MTNINSLESAVWCHENKQQILSPDSYLNNNVSHCILLLQTEVPKKKLR